MAPIALIFAAGMGVGLALTLIALGLWIIATGEPVDDDPHQFPEDEGVVRLMSIWKPRARAPGDCFPVGASCGRDLSFDHDRPLIRKGSQDHA